MIIKSKLSIAFPQVIRRIHETVISKLITRNCAPHEHLHMFKKQQCVKTCLFWRFFENGGD